jgi:hypothetical protein
VCGVDVVQQARVLRPPGRPVRHVAEQRHGVRVLAVVVGVRVLVPERHAAAARGEHEYGYRGKLSDPVHCSTLPDVLRSPHPIYMPVDRPRTGSFRPGGDPANPRSQAMPIPPTPLTASITDTTCACSRLCPLASAGSGDEPVRVPSQGGALAAAVFDRAPRRGHRLREAAARRAAHQHGAAKSWMSCVRTDIIVASSSTPT